MLAVPSQAEIKAALQRQDEESTPDEVRREMLASATHFLELGIALETDQ